MARTMQDGSSMKTIELTERETVLFEGHGSEADQVRREIRSSARETGGAEIYSHDGVLLDVVEAERAA